MKPSKIILYAITENGNGHAQRMAEYDDIDDIRIFVDVFGPNTVLEFVYEQNNLSSNE